jgi:hypothetical protein|tara:strand:- start:1267 stop:1413 length:147 start_codon:yes stop_codon:yes gene_type:complete
MKKRKKQKKKLMKKNPIAKLLRSPMLKNKIVVDKKKIYNRKKLVIEKG